MKRILLNLLLLFTALQLCSCDGLFGFGKDGEEEEEDKKNESVSLQIKSQLLSGSTVQVALYYYGNGEGNYELYFDDQKMEVKKGRNNSVSDSVVIPQKMKGRFTPRIKVDGLFVEISENSPVQVFNWLEEIMPGTAYRADVSKGSTLATEVKETYNEPYITIVYKSYLMNRGREPQVVKFFDAVGKEVPGAFLDQTNVTDQFFVARLWNPSTREESVEYNTMDFTARYSTIYNMPWVIVDKQSGNIIELYKDNGLINNCRIQWMGDRKFCLMPGGYGSEFSTEKLHRFEVDEFMLGPFPKDDIPTDFRHSIVVEEVPYQTNLDVVNNWIAASWDNVYYNRDRMLAAGQLISNSFCTDGAEQNQVVFGNYADGGIYYVCQHSRYEAPLYIHALSGQNSHYSRKAGGRFDIYQYADHTYLRAIAYDVQDEIVSLKITKDEVIEIAQPVTIIEPYYYRMTGNCYPMISIYDYLCDDRSNTLYRRTITSRNDDQKIFTVADAAGTLHILSASATGCSFSVESYENAEMVHTFYDINNAGTVVQIGHLSSREQITMCRLRD